MQCIENSNLHVEPEFHHSHYCHSLDRFWQWSRARCQKHTDCFRIRQMTFISCPSLIICYCPAHHQEWGMGLRFYIRVVLYEHVWILKFQVPNLAPATPCATSICSICRISKTDCMARFPRRHRRPFMFCRPIWRRRSWVYPTICNFKTKNRCFEHHFFPC